MKRPKDTANFLNVDLDIYSRSDLQPLVTAMGRKVDTLHVGRERPRIFSAHLEVHGSGLLRRQSADSLIQQFCAIVESLPRPARRLWNTATRRDFNIGIEGQLQPFSTVLHLSVETLKMAAKLNARIVFTLYCPDLQPRNSTSQLGA